MKLINYNVDYVFDYSLDINIYSLIVENSQEYFKLCNDIIKQSEGEDGSWVLSHNAQQLNMDNVLCIYDFFGLSMNNKKVENLINAQVLQIIKEQDFLQEFSALNNILLKINNKALAQVDLPIISAEEFTYENFVKFSNYKIDEETDLCNKIVTYVDLFIKLKNIKVVALISCFNVLSKEQMQSIIKQLQYMGISVLLINNQNKYEFKNIPKVIIDEDLCLI